MLQEQVPRRAKLASDEPEQLDNRAWMGPAAVLDEAIAEGIVDGNCVGFHLQKIEETGNDDSSSIAPGSTEDDEGRGGRVSQLVNDVDQGRDAIGKHFQIPSGGGSRTLVPRSDPVVARIDEERNRQDPSGGARWQGVGNAPLFWCAEVDGGVDLQGADGASVGGVELFEVAASEEGPRREDRSVTCWKSAKVAKVGTAQLGKGVVTRHIADCLG